MSCILATITGCALIGFYWDELVVQYHLHRLKSEPEYLADICQAQEPDSAAVRAVELFTRTEEGLNKLFEYYVTVARVEERLPRVLRTRSLPLLVYASAVDAVSYAFDVRIETRTVTDGTAPSLERLHPFASCLLERSFSSRNFPEHSFTFITGTELPASLDIARAAISDVPILLLIEQKP